MQSIIMLEMQKLAVTLKSRHNSEHSNRELEVLAKCCASKFSIWWYIQLAESCFIFHNKTSFRFKKSLQSAYLKPD